MVKGFAVALTAGCLANSKPSDVEPGEARSYVAQIQPILARACNECHGPDAQSRQANLRLDLREAVFEDPLGRPIIVPGAPQRSLLYLRITSQEPGRLMPPAPRAQLSTKELTLIREWIEQGAPWSEHWAFIAPVRPAPPAVKDTSWPANEIDSFVLAALGW